MQMNVRRNKLFCFGLGYTAQALIRRLPAGWRFAGTCREGGSAERLRALGIEAHIFDGGAPPAENWLEGADAILTSVPPDAAGDPVLRHFSTLIGAAEAVR
jgi:hypothetical protein